MQSKEEMRAHKQSQTRFSFHSPFCKARTVSTYLNMVIICKVLQRLAHELRIQSNTCKLEQSGTQEIRKGTLIREFLSSNSFSSSSSKLLRRERIEDEDDVHYPFCHVERFLIFHRPPLHGYTSSSRIALPHFVLLLMQTTRTYRAFTGVILNSAVPPLPSSVLLTSDHCPPSTDTRTENDFA